MMSNDKTECTTSPSCGKKCCPVPYIVASFAVFLVIFAFEAVFHGVLMMPHYQATASMWRPPADMQAHMAFGLVRQIGTALVFTCLFGCLLKQSECAECPIKKGAKLGLKIGLILGLAQFGSYAWLPFPDLQIPVMWLVGNTVLGALMGMAAGAVFKIMKKKELDTTLKP
ncbi:MAG: hypothetical protein M3N08_06195 [Pseudomonadota bacterium]|nr:hypothetical protein [Pseudomonadota bacterium]